MLLCVVMLVVVLLLILLLLVVADLVFSVGCVVAPGVEVVDVGVVWWLVFMF